MCPCWGCRDPKHTILCVPHHVIPSGGVHWTRGAPGSPVIAAILLLVVVIVVVLLVVLDQGCAKGLLWFQFLGLLAIAPAHSQGLTKMFFLKLHIKDIFCILRQRIVVLLPCKRMSNTAVFPYTFWMQWPQKRCLPKKNNLPFLSSHRNVCSDIFPAFFLILHVCHVLCPNWLSLIPICFMTWRRERR